MKRPWAFICANADSTDAELRQFCRKVFSLGYEPICPKLTYSQLLNLTDPEERSAYEDFVRDKLLRSPMLVVCCREPDTHANLQIGMAQRYNKICTTLDGLLKAVQS